LRFGEHCHGGPAAKGTKKISYKTGNGCSKAISLITRKTKSGLGIDNIIPHRLKYKKFSR
jgi:hypothetical protein